MVGFDFKSITKKVEWLLLSLFTVVNKKHLLVGILKRAGINIVLEATPLETNLTSSEVSPLWSAYVTNSMFKVHLRYFLAKCEDAEIHSILDYALQIANGIVKGVGEFFSQAQHPIPIGFTDEDVNIKAPRLYTDTFYLHNLHGLTQYGLVGHSLSLSVAARPDIRKFLRNV